MGCDFRAWHEYGVVKIVELLAAQLLLAAELLAQVRAMVVRENGNFFSGTVVGGELLAQVWAMLMRESGNFLTILWVLDGLHGGFR